MNQSGAENPGRLYEQLPPEPLRRPNFQFPEPSQLSVAWYAAWISLSALYIAHTSWNATADIGVLANEIATAGVTQTQVGNQIQLLQLCLINSTLLAGPCESILAAAPLLLPKITALTTANYNGNLGTNVGIDLRFKEQLLGFHIIFFALVGLSMFHFIYALWRPVTCYLRERRYWRECSATMHGCADLPITAGTRVRREERRELRKAEERSYQLENRLFGNVRAGT